MKESKDSIGDRLKAIEQAEAGRRADPSKPLIARLDGKAFHVFTRGLKRPYDIELSNLMVDTTKFLVEKTHALLGYTQSDEISLYWSLEGMADGSEYPYSGKFQKMTSILASMAGGYFNVQLANGRIPGKQPAITNSFQAFDCRVWNVEDQQQVFSNFLWRQDDAIKNSISMAAQVHFSHKVLDGVGSEVRKKMLREAGFPWEDEPAFFKMGTFVRRKSQMVELTSAQRELIPEKYRPTGPVERTVIEDIKLGYLRNDHDRVAEIFGVALLQPNDKATT
jgi:tRNA(His) 5'-end guanylyltransferase